MKLYTLSVDLLLDDELVFGEVERSVGGRSRGIARRSVLSHRFDDLGEADVVERSVREHRFEYLEDLDFGVLRADRISLRPDRAR